MVIKINYTSSDIYVSTNVSPIYVVVNYSGVSTGGGVWGQITGTLSNQTDLQTALNAKFDDPTGTTSQYLRGDGSLATFPTIPSGTVTSVGLTMPSAFAVANSPITSSGTLAVTGAGTASQYVRGDGQLANFPTLTGYIPYTGATANVDLGEFGIRAGQFTLDTSPTGTAAVGTTRWNDALGSSETTLKGGSVILKNGVDLVARVVNKVTPNATLTKAAYQAVRVSGAQGQRLAVAYAQANNDANSADTLGLVIETIPTNQEGFIITMGQIENINTTGSLQGETWVDGDVLYLSPTTPGAITKVKPTGAGHIVVIGYVEYAHVNNGKIYVKVMNGWELDELHDVDIVSPTNNEALIYESSTSLWKNKTIATALGYTPISGSGVAGQVAYWSGTNSQTGSNNLFWDAANNRLGIGTATPSAKLHVDDGTGAALFVGLASNIYYRAYEHIWQSLNGTFERMRIDPNGNLGLGVTPSAWYSASNGIAMQMNAGSLYSLYTNSFYVNQNAYLNASASWIYTSNNPASQYLQHVGNHYWSNAPSGTAGNAITFTQAMTLTSGGNLLLGTTTDSGYKLDVNGTARVSGMITGRTLSNSTGASDYAIELNGISTTDATTRILINCGTLNATGIGYGARALQATIDGYGVGTFIRNNTSNSAIGHVVVSNGNSLAIPAFAAQTNGQSAGGSVGYIWMNGNTQSFFHSIMHNEELRFYNPTGTIYSIRDRLTTNITFGSNTHYASAQFAIDSTTKGFLPPRMTTTQKNAISSPDTGLQVYDTTLGSLNVYNGSSWVALGAGGGGSVDELQVSLICQVFG